MTEVQGTEELPDQIFLPPSRGRWIFALAVSALIVGLDLFLVLTGDAPALWFMVAIFLVTGAFAASQLIPGSAGLWLDRRGFTYRLFWVDRRREWKEITPILSNQVGLLQMVGYNRASDAPGKPREVLPDTYGISASELADLMNHWRDTAIKAG